MSDGLATLGVRGDPTTLSRGKLLSWLKNLEAVTTKENKSVLEKSAGKLIGAIIATIGKGHGPPIQKRAARCIASILDAVGTRELSGAMDRCIEVIKGRDDTQAKTGVLTIIGECAEKLGRILSPFLPDLLKELPKAYKACDDIQVRIAILRAISSVIIQFGSSASFGFKDIFKSIKNGLVDRSPLVRMAAAECALALTEQSNHIQTTELDGIVSACMKSFDGSTYILRRALARLLGTVLSSCHIEETWRGMKSSKRPSADDLAGMLSVCFLKSPSNEVRVGVAQAYVVYLVNMGPTWLEKQASAVVRSLLQLLVQLKPQDSPICARKCVLHIIRNAHARTLGENGRTDTVLAVCSYVMSLLDVKDPKQRDLGVHAVVCGLNAASELVQIIGTSIESKYEGVMKPLLAAGLSPYPTIRFAAADCLRSLGNVLPSRASFLANQCMDRMKAHRTSPDAVHGAGYLLAAVIGGSASSSLGLPHELSSSILNLGEQLSGRKLIGPKGEAVNPATVLADVEAGWALVGSLTSLGSAAVDPHVKKLVSLWHTAFPVGGRTTLNPKDIAGWTALLHQQIGALTSMRGFLLDCKELATVDISKIIAGLVAKSFRCIADMPTTSKAQVLQPLAIKVRVRLYRLYLIIPVHIFEESIPKLLPFLVADFTLVETGQSSTGTTSLLRSLCNESDSILLGRTETDQQDVEDILQEHGDLGLRAIENDPHMLFFPASRYTDMPLSNITSVIDAAILLFGICFPCVTSQKHRLQLLDHFATTIRKEKAVPRRQAVQINIFAAFLAGMQSTVQRRGSLGSEKVIAAARGLVLDALSNADNTLRCAAGEALGRMGQVVGSNFVTDTLTHSIERIKKDANVHPRTGFSLGLGCILRYVGSMGSSTRHLKGTIEILQALTRDATPIVCAWSLYSLTLTVNAAGQALDSFIDPIIKVVRRVVLDTPAGNIQVLECAGKLLNTLITAVGPELQVDESRREAILELCNELQESRSGLVRLAGLNGIQQLIIFAPKFVDIPRFIPRLQTTLSSPLLQLRLAAAACMRQLAQRDPLMVFQYGTDVERVLFQMLDSEDDPRLLSDLQEAITSMLLAHAANAPLHWLRVCNRVLSGEAEADSAQSPPDDEQHDDEEGGRVQMKAAVRTVLRTRWETKVFAVQCVRKIITVCIEVSSYNVNPHFHLAEARKQNGDFLISQLSEVIRTSYLAATSTINELRMVGLQALEDIISNFSGSVDPDLDGNHSLLEEYQAQVTSALRPAFDASTPPDVTCVAAHVVSAWICSGVYRKVSDLRRVLTLLEHRLEAVKSAPDPAYNERATTKLRLALLVSWGRIACKASEKLSGFEYLTEVVSPHGAVLASHWVAALHDYALTSLPSEYGDQIPSKGNFYYDGTKAAVLPYYTDAFPVLVLGAAQYATVDESASNQSTYYMILGLCTRTLCSNSVPAAAILAAVLSLRYLFAKSTRIFSDEGLFYEVTLVLQRAIRDHGADVRIAVLDVVTLLLRSQDYPKSGGSLDGPPTSIQSMVDLYTLALVRELPEIVPDAARPRLGSYVTGPSGGPNADVVARAVEGLGILPTLCPETHREGVLRTVLVELVKVMQVPTAAGGAVVLPALRCALQSVDGESDGAVETRSSVILATVLAVLEALKSHECANPRPMLLSLAVFLFSSPAVAWSPEVEAGLVNVLNQHTSEASDPELQQTAIQVVNSIIKLPGISPAPYVQSLCPTILGLLVSASAVPPKSEAELAVLREALSNASALLAVAADEKRAGMLAVVVANCVGLLNTQASGLPRQLHVIALDLLKKVGPLYPAEFKAVMAAAPALAQKVGDAIQAEARTTSSGSAGAGARGTQPGTSAAAPKIQLKMDFSAFG